MGRSQETFGKKEVRTKKEKKRKEKEKKRLAKKESEKKTDPDDMIAYVDANGRITSAPPDPSNKEDIELEDIEVSVPKSDNTHKNDPIRTGIVSFFNESKGYGFIKDSITKQDVFVHINNTLDEIKEGNLVTFEIGSGQKGPAAMNVKKLKQ
ncbi:MAG: cold shock domain-containing protein [Bacteroidales bacterium]|nr:cold shock domain-containing protein [Bacteroidales bacterium]